MKATNGQTGTLIRKTPRENRAILEISVGCEGSPAEGRLGTEESPTGRAGWVEPSACRGRGMAPPAGKRGRTPAKPAPSHGEPCPQSRRTLPPV